MLKVQLAMFGRFIRLCNNIIIIIKGLHCLVDIFRLDLSVLYRGFFIPRDQESLEIKCI